MLPSALVPAAPAPPSVLKKRTLERPGALGECPSAPVGEPLLGALRVHPPNPLPLPLPAPAAPNTPDAAASSTAGAAPPTDAASPGAAADAPLPPPAAAAAAMGIEFTPLEPSARCVVLERRCSAVADMVRCAEKQRDTRGAPLLPGGDDGRWR